MSKNLCKACAACPHTKVSLSSPSELESYKQLLDKLVNEEVLKAIHDFDTPDFIEIRVKCNHCGREIELICEMYHGIGIGYIGTAKKKRK